MKGTKPFAVSPWLSWQGPEVPEFIVRMSVQERLDFLQFAASRLLAGTNPCPPDRVAAFVANALSRSPGTEPFLGEVSRFGEEVSAGGPLTAEAVRRRTIELIGSIRRGSAGAGRFDAPGAGA